MDGEEGSKITVALLEGHSKSSVGIQHGRIELEHMVFFIQVIDDGKCSFSNDTFVELPFQGSNPFTLSLYIL